MFDITSITRLQEKLDYEQWIILRALEVIQMHKGQISRSIVFENNSYKTHLLQVIDNLGANGQAEVIKDISPLLFGACFKVLDMIVEWIVEENNQVIRDNSFRNLWSFRSKIDYLHKHMSAINLPYPFGTDHTLFKAFFGLYSNLYLFRNKLVHGKWGKNQDGNLDFDFEQSGNRIQKTISFEEIAKFADCIVLCVKEIIFQQSSVSDKRIETIKWGLDNLISLHQENSFNASIPVYINVICNFQVSRGETIKIDLATIKDNLDCDSHGYPYKFLLHIIVEDEAEKREWLIPSISLLSNDKELILDSSWDAFIV